jgi:hypothetical protein
LLLPKSLNFVFEEPIPLIRQAPAAALQASRTFFEVDVESIFIRGENSLKENDLLEPDCSISDFFKDIFVVDKLLAIVSQILEFALLAQPPKMFCPLQAVAVQFF